MDSELGCPQFESEVSVRPEVEEIVIQEAIEPSPNLATTRAARAAIRKAEKEAALRRRQVKGKAICEEDSKSRRSAREAVSIARFFISSRNPSSSQPLCMKNTKSSTPISGRPQSVSNSISLDSVSLDIEMLDSEPPSLSEKGSSSIPSKFPVESQATLQIHRQLRDDMVQISDGEEEVESDDDIEEIPPPKKTKTNYDVSRRFQNEWAAKLVWAEPIRGNDGHVHLVKCTVCSTFEKTPKILGPKWDTLQKHEGRRKAAFNMPKYNVKAGEWYISKTSRHQINLRHFAARQPLSVLQQVNTSTSMARSKKTVQFCTIFQILSSGRPMLEYEERQALYSFLNVPSLPRMHWTDSSGWQMADCLYSQVQQAVKKKINSAHFISITCDEVTTVDNGSWLCIHGYIVENYVRVPLLISLQRLVEGATADALTLVIMKALEGAGDLTFQQISKRLTCFGADGVSTFQGVRTGVTVQIVTKFAPFCIGVHCMAHRCNLAAKSLSVLPIFATIEQVIQKIHSYFSKSPKRLSEYQKLAEDLELKGLKPLLQVTTRWVSLLEPLRRLLAEYRTLLAKMKADVSKNEAAEV